MTGVDLTPRSIEISRRHLTVYQQAGDFVLTDGEHLPFADESFDVVYSNGVLHHTPDTAGAIQEIHRVLKPGGQTRVMLYHRTSIAYWVNIMLRYGILNAELFRGLTAEEIMSRHVETTENDARPLVKVYTRKQARTLFSMFSRVHVQVEQLTRGDLHFLGRMTPETLLHRLGRIYGWNLVITAFK